MQFHDIEQNTDEWLDLKSGKLSGSSISKVMATSNEYRIFTLGKESFGIANTFTNKMFAKRYPNKIEAETALAEMKKKDPQKAFGETAKKLAVTIAREQVTGKRSIAEQYSNEHMERGHEQEPVARALYEDEYFVTVTNGGFFDCGHVGCSPDGLVNGDGLVEIKSVVDHVHYATIKRGGIDPTYKWQIYFNLLTTERQWIDFISYCADFPPHKRLYVFRVHRNECKEQFEMINKRTTEFFKLVDECKQIIEG